MRNTLDISKSIQVHRKITNSLLRGLFSLCNQSANGVNDTFLHDRYNILFIWKMVNIHIEFVIRLDNPTLSSFSTMLWHRNTTQLIPIILWTNIKYKIDYEKLCRLSLYRAYRSNYVIFQFLFNVFVEIKSLIMFGGKIRWKEKWEYIRLYKVTSTAFVKVK